jgi:hypothetical protein
MILNRLGNYIGKAYTVSEGCLTCKEDKKLLSEDV